MRDNLAPHKAVLLGSGLPDFSKADAKAIAAPTLLVTGQHTVAAHRHVNRRLAELIPGAMEVIVEGASHPVHEDRPLLVGKLILGWLGEV
ncbi:hypothetical protein DFJ74DRAFT_657393 [Hyaloraphidium curvatum]|nr:hypothetical protein DFJ74DRAFT_657393 [Hyaloraphidium curvatum]